MTETIRITKPSGWKGAKEDAYWTKDSKYGVRYKCSACGREVLGSGSADRMHWTDCPVRVEWAAKQAEKKAAEVAEAAAWLSLHRAGIIAALDGCEEVHRLKEVARLLRYEVTP